MGGFNPKQLQEMMSRPSASTKSCSSKMQETMVEATAGGGSVTVKMNGQKQVLTSRSIPRW